MLTRLAAHFCMFSISKQMNKQMFIFHLKWIHGSKTLISRVEVKWEKSRSFDKNWKNPLRTAVFHTPSVNTEADQNEWNLFVIYIFILCHWKCHHLVRMLKDRKALQTMDGNEIHMRWYAAPSSIIDFINSIQYIFAEKKGLDTLSITKSTCQKKDEKWTLQHFM